MKIVVIGGSVSGLAFGLFAARRGMKVTILEADPLADPALTVDEMLARNPRRATPQSAHSHAFLSRTHQILASETPDVLDAFEVHGIESVRLADHLPHTLTDRRHRQGDNPLIVLRARRSTFEAALRSVAATEPGLTIRAGVSVSGLALDRSINPPKVRGLETSSGQIDADIVIDASGRRGRTFAWLDSAGLKANEEISECGIAYYTRFYRRYFGEQLGPLNRGYTAGSSFDRYSTLVFPSDNNTFSVTFGILPEDNALRKLRHNAAFTAATRSIPMISDWVNRGEPISDVRSMTGMKNRMRRLVTETPAGDREPVVTGLIPLGDAAGISNPAHSRGCSLAITHAREIAELLDVHMVSLGSAEEIALRADDIVNATIAPWVEDSRRQDEARLSRWRSNGDHVAPPVEPGLISNGEAWTAAHHDREVWSRFTGLQQLLLTPADVLADEETIARVRSVQARGLSLPALSGPTHDDLANILSASAGPTSERRLAIAV